ncbi:DUF6783 domain-containing protein [Eisenbergiella sp.]|uniref:DUF6783 domain-containing protein n=1 Tax=Eisenbergiella sp. TaxID=1924109 RepID=UPI003FA49F88
MGHSHNQGLRTLYEKNLEWGVQIAGMNFQTHAIAGKHVCLQDVSERRSKRFRDNSPEPFCCDSRPRCFAIQAHTPYFYVEFPARLCYNHNSISWLEALRSRSGLVCYICFAYLAFRL